MGILVNTVSEFEGYKKKIEKSFDIRAHFQVSVDLQYNGASLQCVCVCVFRNQWSSTHAIRMLIIFLVNGQ